MKGFQSSKYFALWLVDNNSHINQSMFKPVNISFKFMVLTKNSHYQVKKICSNKQLQLSGYVCLKHHYYKMSQPSSKFSRFHDARL